MVQYSIRGHFTFLKHIAVNGSRRQKSMETQRIYQGEDAQWHFNVRGNQSMGPYDSYQNAELALTAHVSTCRRRLKIPDILPKLLAPLMSRRHRNQPRHT